MSIYGVAWALDRVRGISVGAKIVLISLAEFANEQDVTWVSRERLISRVECSPRTLSGYFKELEACGALTREARYEWCTSESCSRTGEHKHRRGTVYRIHPELRIDVRKATSAESAPVRESLESQRKSHSGNICASEDTVANLRRSQAQTSATITYRKEPPIEPPNLTPPPPVVEGSVGLGTGCADHVIVEGEAASPVATSAPPEGRRGPQKRPWDGRGAESASDGDLAILAACVPEQFRVMDARGLGLVVGLLRERLDAGWRPAEIKRLLDSPPPAEGVKFMSRFVAKRLERLVAVGESPRAQAAAASRERERLASQRAAVVDAQAAEAAPSVVHMRIHDLVTELAPGLSRARCAVVELAVQQALTDLWRRENPRGGKPSSPELLEVLAASGERIAARVIAEHVDEGVA
ncbi:MAG: helix-turn-helix domain-containing protein [Pauljensenia sp.]